MGSGQYNQRLKIDTSENESEIKRFLHIIKAKVDRHCYLILKVLKFTSANNCDIENADFISKSGLMQTRNIKIFYF